MFSFCLVCYSCLSLEEDGCYLSRLLLLTSLLLFGLHQALLSAQQLFVQNIRLIFSLRVCKHTSTQTLYLQLQQSTTFTHIKKGVQTCNKC